MGKELKAKDLYYKVNLRDIPFKSTADVEPLEGVIAQERAIDAIKTGLVLKKRNFNIFVCGISGTGRTSTVKDLVQKQAATEPVPDDWVIVNNFKHPEHPLTVNFPAGKGLEFKKSMADFVEDLKQELPKALQSKEYQETVQQMLTEGVREQTELFENMAKKAQELDFMVRSTRVGIVTVPVKDGKPIDNKDFSELPDEEKQAFEKKRQELEPVVREFILKSREVEQNTRKRIREEQKNVALKVISRNIDFLYDEFGHSPKLDKYLKMLKDYIVENAAIFNAGSDEEEEADWTMFDVNVIVDNSELKGAPVIFEDMPTYYNLVGKMEKRVENGIYMSDFTMIKAGALLRANGGYLMVNARDVLTHPFAWFALKRVLKTQELKIEDMGEQYMFLPTSGMKPDPIKLHCKVVLIGSSQIFSLLYEWDEDFRKIFQIKAEFDYEIPRNKATIAQYARFMAATCKREGLMAVDKSGIAAVVEFGSRLSESKLDMSVRFNQISNLLVEADLLARNQGQKVIKRAHVEQAAMRREQRSSIWKEKIFRSIAREMTLLDTKGEEVGQINGLAVYETGELRFGKPIRLTVETFKGKGGIINVERESRLSGKVFNKAVYVITGLLGRWFGRNHELSLNINLVVEQSYGGIDGDSASVAEVAVIISSLANVPIKQGIAVTGSVNQKGMVQPIGGVNEKIEGFFEVCKQQGLTGDQGVIIPASNLNNLMLKQEVVNAVKRGHFHVWAIDRVEEALKLLMGMDAGTPDDEGYYPDDSLFGRVEKTLDLFEGNHREEEDDSEDPESSEKTGGVPSEG